MNKHTIDNMDIGACYSVTCTSAATVTAEINGATATLLSLPSGGSGTFFAPADSVCVETEGEFRVLPTDAPAMLGNAGGGSAPGAVDPVPVEGSANPVASGGVYDAISAVSPPEGNVARLENNNTFTQTNTFNGTVALNGAVQVSGAVGGIGLARAAFNASPVFTATADERMLYEPMLTGRPHVCLYAPSLNISTGMKPALDTSIPDENDQFYYGYNWYRQAETLDLHVGGIGAASRLKGKAWFIRLHMNTPNTLNHSLFRSDGCHPNLRVLHLSTSDSSFGVSANGFLEKLTRLEDFVLSGPAATSVHVAGTAAFPGARHLRSARIYLPKLASSTTLLKDSPLDKDSLLFLMRWLPVPTNKTLTFTIGIDAAMSDEDQAEVTAKAESLLDPDTGFGWNMVFNPATYA